MHSLPASANEGLLMFVACCVSRPLSYPSPQQCIVHAAGDKTVNKIAIDK